MSVPLLERLPRMLANGRRTAMRLSESAKGRHRERAILQEVVRADCDRSTRCRRRASCAANPCSPSPHCWPNARRGTTPTSISRCWTCMRPPARTRWRAGSNAGFPASCWRACCVRASTCARPPTTTQCCNWCLEALDARGSDGSDETAPEGGALLLSDDTMRFRAMARPRRRWIACTPDGARLAHFRRTLVARGDIDVHRRIRRHGACRMGAPQRRNATGRRDARRPRRMGRKPLPPPGTPTTRVAAQARMH